MLDSEWREHCERIWRESDMRKRWLERDSVQRWMLCLHEAAHAVAAHSLGLNVVEVSVIANKSTAGRAVFDDLGDGDALVAIYAGPAVELLAGGDVDRIIQRAGIDIRLAENLDADVSRNIEAVKAAHTLVCDRWPAIERLASVLRENRCVCGPELQQILHMSDNAALIICDQRRNMLALA